ncbi:hypothetical protein [Microbacterium excoecariae]|uniref:A1S_2505 family phage non-structural protein n=1 Tax=Microbacterium excoecariae TaxID=2715210 RepID=UPI00140B3F56|nr:hypothetical protein [Microbacterium excoecariae]NHI17155.1 hypothetical protein [Microbacterium excoecariae]
MDIFSAMLARLDTEARDRLMRAMRTPAVVSGLEPHEILVYGAGEDGRAAVIARERFGADPEVLAGRTGRAYALDAGHGWYALAESVRGLLAQARREPSTVFLLTPVGLGEHAPGSIAAMFAHAPANIVLPALYADALGRR